MRPSLPLILAAALTAGATAGCGLKNDLYLPPDDARQTEDQTDQDAEADHAENPRT